jgi:hypothetical protein
MVHISEWLPNPAGSDTAEWVELFNDSNASVNLSGWSLKTSKGKPIALRAEVPPGGYLILRKANFNFSLRNSDETLSLYDPAGKLADQSSYRGVAEEGKSVNHLGPTSFFGIPTPGAANVAHTAGLIDEAHPFNVVLNPGRSFLVPFGEALGTGLVLAILAVFIIQQFDGLSELFFGKY